MSTTERIVLAVLGSFALIAVVYYMYRRSKSSPVPAPTPGPASTFAFKAPVNAQKLLPVSSSGAGSAAVTIETPVALFVYDDKCACDVAKQTFQTFAAANPGYFVCFELNASSATGAVRLAELGLEPKTMPTIFVFRLGVVSTSVTDVTEANLQKLVLKANFKAPVQELTMQDFSATGNLVDAQKKGFVFVVKGQCPMCDAVSIVVQAFAERVSQCRVYFVDADSSVGKEFLKTTQAISTYPGLLAYSETAFVKKPTPPVPTVAGFKKFVGLESADIFITPPIQGIVDAKRWGKGRYVPLAANKPTLIFVYDDATPTSDMNAFRAFVSENESLASYEVLSASIPNQFAFFAAAGSAAPAPYPVVVKFDVGGLPSKQTTRDFSATALAKVVAFNFAGGVKSVTAVENFLIPGTNTASAAYVTAAPACVFVFSGDGCKCDAKKRVYQQVADGGAANLFFADASDPATASFFTGSKIDRSVVAVHKWLQGTGDYSPDPVTTTFDAATIGAYVV